MSGVSGGLAAATAAASIASGVSDMVNPQETQQAPAGQYIPPSVTTKEANAQNAKVLAAINKAIRRNNKYQRRLERERHAESREDINWFRSQIEGAVELADPYVKERARYIDNMRALMEDPTAFLQKSPEYRARMAGGLEALTSQLASKGLIGSGNVAIEAQALGAREASAQLGKDWDRLAELSGLKSANLGAAAELQAGGRVPFTGDYRSQFEGEQFHPAAFEQSNMQLKPGEMFVHPDNRLAFGHEIGTGLGGLAGVDAMWDSRNRIAELDRLVRGSFTNDQGFAVSY
jgi:hypothetical protein